MSYPIDINDLCYGAHVNSKDKGFWYDAINDKVNQAQERTILLSKLALVTSEIGEAIEALRQPTYGNITEELADICIRVFDMAGYLNVNLQQAITNKMNKNASRPRMHGKEA